MTDHDQLIAVLTSALDQCGLTPEEAAGTIRRANRLWSGKESTWVMVKQWLLAAAIVAGSADGYRRTGEAMMKVLEAWEKDDARYARTHKD